MNQLSAWTLTDYFLAIFRFKGRVLTICLLAILGGVAWIQYSPKRYVSEAKFFVRVGRENATLDPTVLNGDQLAIGSSLSREIEINSIVEHLRSRAIIEKTWDAIRPANVSETPLDRERAIVRLKDRLQITSPRQSTIITIVAKGDTPDEARRIVGAMTEIYLEEHMRVSRPIGSYEFLERQSSRLREEYELAQAELRDAKNRGGMASIDTRSNSLESQINGVETQLHQVAGEHAAAVARLESKRTVAATLPVPLLKQMVGGTPNDGLAAMRDRLFELQVEQEQLRSKLSAKHPSVVAVGKQAEELSRMLSAEDPVRDQIIAALCADEEAGKVAIEAQEQSLREKLTDLRKSIEKLNEDEILVAQATLKVRQLETKYQAYGANTEGARIDDALHADKISNLSVIQPASLSPLAVSPKKATCLLIAAFCGLVGGIALALLSEHVERLRLACNVMSIAGIDAPSESLASPSHGGMASSRGANALRTAAL